MKYTDEYANKILSDKRYVGAVNAKMVRVWKTRGKIPNQYFNPSYVRLMKEGKDDLANQVFEKCYNDTFTVRIEASPAEKKQHDRIIEILADSRIIIRQIFDQVELPINFHVDAVRKDGRSVDICPANVIKIKTNIVELRAKMKKTIIKMEGKTVFSDLNMKEIDKVVQDVRLSTTSFLFGNKNYAARTTQRRNGAYRTPDNDEYLHYINCMYMFLLETQI